MILTKGQNFLSTNSLVSLKPLPHISIVILILKKTKSFTYPFNIIEFVKFSSYILRRGGNYAFEDGNFLFLMNHFDQYSNKKVIILRSKFPTPPKNIAVKFYNLFRQNDS